MSPVYDERGERYPTAREEAGEERLRERTERLASEASPIPCQECGGFPELTIKACRCNGACPHGGCEVACDHCRDTPGCEPCTCCQDAPAVLRVGREYCCVACAPDEAVWFAQQPRRERRTA
jgi:hypothetical protein